MSLRLEVKKLMLERSPRVKSIDFHPINPWIVFGLYSGTLSLYDYSNNVNLYKIRRLVFVHYKPRLLPFVQSNLFLRKIGLFVDLMIFIFEFLITIQCKKSSQLKRMPIL